MIRFSLTETDNSLIWNEEVHLNELIIESPTFYRQIIKNLSANLDDCNYFTLDGKTLRAKHIDFISNPFLLNFNDKKVIATLLKLLVKQSISESFYNETNSFKSYIIKYLDELIYAENFNFEVETDPDFSIDSIAKAVNIHIVGDEDNFIELLTDYLDMMTELSDIKLFVFMNLRAFLEKEDIELLIKNINNHQLDLLLIESQQKSKISNSNQLIIDKDLCEI